MDLTKTIRDLCAERDDLDRAIASLEELQRAAAANAVVPGRSKGRGRKSMGTREHQEVSDGISPSAPEATFKPFRSLPGTPVSRKFTRAAAWSTCCGRRRPRARLGPKPPWPSLTSTSGVAPMA